MYKGGDESANGDGLLNGNGDGVRCVRTSGNSSDSRYSDVLPPGVLFEMKGTHNSGCLVHMQLLEEEIAYDRFRKYS